MRLSSGNTFLSSRLKVRHCHSRRRQTETRLPQDTSAGGGPRLVQRDVAWPVRKTSRIAKQVIAGKVNHPWPGVHGEAVASLTNRRRLTSADGSLYQSPPPAYFTRGSDRALETLPDCAEAAPARRELPETLQQRVHGRQSHASRYQTGQEESNRGDGRPENCRLRTHNRAPLPTCLSTGGGGHDVRDSDRTIARGSRRNSSRIVSTAYLMFSARSSGVAVC